MMGPTLGTGVRTGELGELPGAGGWAVETALSSPSSVLSRLAIKLPDARACVYTCVCRCTRTNEHTPRDLGLFSHELGTPFPVWSRTRPPGSSEQDSQAAQGLAVGLAVAWPAHMGRPTERANPPPSRITHQSSAAGCPGDPQPRATTHH